MLFLSDQVHEQPVARQKCTAGEQISGQPPPFASGCKNSNTGVTTVILMFELFALESHQVLAQLLDTLLVIGTQLPENPTVRHRLIEVACKVTNPGAQSRHHVQPKKDKTIWIY